MEETSKFGCQEKRIFFFHFIFLAICSNQKPSKLIWNWKKNSKSKDGCIYEYEDLPGKIWCFKAGSEPTKCLDSGNITKLRKNVVFI